MFKVKACKLSKISVQGLLVIAVCAVGSAAMAAEQNGQQQPQTDARTVVDTIRDLWGNVRYALAEVHFTQEFHGKPRNNVKDRYAEMEYAGEGDNTLAKYEWLEKTPDQMFDFLAFYDGYEIDLHTQFMSGENYFEIPVGAGMASAGSGQIELDLLTRYFDLEVLPEENVEGQPAYVLQGVPVLEIPIKPNLAGVRAWFSKATGAPLKFHIYTSTSDEDEAEEAGLIEATAVYDYERIMRAGLPAPGSSRQTGSTGRDSAPSTQPAPEQKAATQ